MSDIVLRDAAIDDMKAGQAIYAHHVLNGLASFEETPPDLAEIERRWHAVTASGFPWLAAERNGAVVGYSYATQYRPRPAYRYTVEDSVYVAAGEAGHGIGRMLLAGLIERCAARGLRQMVAIIGDTDNRRSEAHTSELQSLMSISYAVFC